MKENAYTSRFVTERNRDLSYTSSSRNHVGKRNIDMRQQVKLKCSESVADKEKKNLARRMQFLQTGGIFATICSTNYIEVQVKVKAAS
jgi:hypothetical protein